MLSDLRLVHGVFNAIVMLFFLYQGRLGFRIRRDRGTGAPLPVPVIKRHRRMGPVLAILGGLGFLAGLTLVLLDTGNVLEYPLHFIAGLTIVVLLIATYKISRDIKGPDSPFRTPHFVLGVAILCLYLVNVMIGIGALL
ncbi:MAG: DUF4079 domain-containing protein [Nitrospirae bacterium]|nr:DUF4079 domain-containing protein [Nitrospirota bacterium]